MACGRVARTSSCGPCCRRFSLALAGCGPALTAALACCGPALTAALACCGPALTFFATAAARGLPLRRTSSARRQVGLRRKAEGRWKGVLGHGIDVHLDQALDVRKIG